LYLGKHSRYEFQIDLGIAVVNHGIEQEWEDDDGPCLNWMCQADFLPCECKKCFFSINGLTNGIAHKTIEDNDNICSERWYSYGTRRMH
jgi:hypothetical protein